MKKFNRVLGLAVLVVLMLAGVSFADPIAWDYKFEYYNGSTESDPDGTGVVGARVYLDVEQVGDLYTYTYQVENVWYDPAGDGIDESIYRFALPVTVPVVVGQGTHDPSLVGVILPVSPVTSGGVVEVSFMGYGLWPDTIYPGESLSDPFYIQSTIGWDWGNSVLTDGESANLLVLSNLDTTGGGNEENPVPEPATLLLMGIGALGLEGFRRFKSRRA